MFLAEGVTQAQLDKGERRTLDCIDCHNRPSHTFAFSAERAVDDAMAAGGFDAKLPFVRREAVKVLKASYATKDVAFAGIKGGLSTFYRETYPQAPADQVARAIATAQHLYERNVFPTMKVAWGSYAN
ncbi:MAG: cytochrome C, partial [Acidobacteria bacterium]|nr:cytochrome C [Acidobacteriota bacterium]